MKLIRKGKDIHLRWEIIIADGQVSLDDADLRIVLTAPNGAKCVLSHIVEGGAVVMNYPGTRHGALGTYKLTAWLNYGQSGQSAVDAIKAFRLVPDTTFENDESEALDYAEVELFSRLEAGVKGDSAYQAWLNEGHVGTEADFINWLRLPATEAGTRAQEMADLAEEKATLADEKAQLAGTKAAEADTAAGYAKQQGDYAKEKAETVDAVTEYAKEQGDYAKQQGDHAKNETTAMQAAVTRTIDEQIRRINEQMELALDGSNAVTNILDI